MSVNPYKSPRDDDPDRFADRGRWKRLLLYSASAAGGTVLTSVLWHYLVGATQQLPALPFYAVALALGGGCGALAIDIAISTVRGK